MERRSAVFARYAEWLRREWSVRPDESEAIEEAPYDPRAPSRSIGEEFAVRESGGADHATQMLARTLVRVREEISGSLVWELGCGTGLLSSVAKKLGARLVCATDIDREMVVRARRTARESGVEILPAVADLKVHPPWRGLFDVVIALLPQKPCPDDSLPLVYHGGEDGARLVDAVVEGGLHWLAPGGRSFLFVHSLCHPRAVVRLHELYDVTLLAVKERLFDAEDFPTLYPAWLERRRRGEMYFEDRPDGRHSFLCAVYRASAASTSKPGGSL